MAEGNEKMYGLKIRMRQIAYRAIAFNKNVPKCVLLSLERNTSMEKSREIVSQISGTAIIEIDGSLRSSFPRSARASRRSDVVEEVRKRTGERTAD